MMRFPTSIKPLLLPILLFSLHTEINAFITTHHRHLHHPLLTTHHHHTTTTTTPQQPLLMTSSPSFASTALSISSTISTLRNKIIVVKYGGNAMTTPSLALSFCQDIASLQNLGIKIIVVHGGGPQISAMLKQLNVETTFSPGGLRISSPEVVDVAEMVLCGSVNKKIANAICNAGGRAVGLSGRDMRLLQCTKQLDGDGSDVGFVGKVEVVNTEFLESLLSMGITPVISPIGCGMEEEDGVAYNVNADVAAGRIAGELKAERVVFLTDIKGVLDKNMELLRTLSVSDVAALIEDETITGGMIPKVSYATDAVNLGVKGAFITDGRVPHAVLNEVLGQDDGTGEGGTIITGE